MATKKPKTSKTSKSKTNKSKSAEKTVVKPVEAKKVNEVEKTEKDNKKKESFFLKGFFSKKYEEDESVLTVFKNHKFYGALLGEVIGTLFITLVLFTFSLLGIANIATSSFLLVAIFIAIYSFSSACLNPIVAVGMMATRRISVIRGVMYIVAEIVGAWIAWLIFNSFHLIGGDNAYDIPSMATIGENQFWTFVLIELIGAIIIAFFFARALKYKRSVFTFAATIAGGMGLAVMIGYTVSAAFVELSSNFIFNPAAALMFKIFPESGDSFGTIIGGITQALSVYVVFPMIGGVLGFYLSDFTSKLSAEE